MAANVYVQTNEASDNQLVAFTRVDDGALAPLRRFPAGGRGSGEPQMASPGLGRHQRRQTLGSGWVTVTNDGPLRLVTNFGDGTVSSYENCRHPHPQGRPCRQGP
ncbi:MAG: hypothetical protein WAN22_17020 [Solirubrobacteraceae bacterium]